MSSVCFNLKCKYCIWLGPRSNVCFTLKCKYCIWLGPKSSVCLKLACGIVGGSHVHCAPK
jgi:hypothetical protein